MVLIPHEEKSIKGLEAGSHSAPIFSPEAPPPYSPTDPSSSASTTSRTAFNSLYDTTPEVAPSSEKQTQLQNEPNTRIPESNAISASKAVNLTGPLRILGKVSSSSSVTLSGQVFVEGKVSSSSYVILSDGVTVEGKIDASGKIVLRNGVRVDGKVDASGSVEIIGEAYVTEKIDARSSVLLDASGYGQHIQVGGKVDCGSSCEIRGNVEISGDVDARGKVKIICTDGTTFNLGGKIKSNASTNVEGNLIVKKDFVVKGSLTLNGRLHIQGDLEVNGSVSMKRGKAVKQDYTCFFEASFRSANRYLTRPCHTVPQTLKPQPNPQIQNRRNFRIHLAPMPSASRFETFSFQESRQTFKSLNSGTVPYLAYSAPSKYQPQLSRQKTFSSSRPTADMQTSIIILGLSALQGVLGHVVRQSDCSQDNCYREVLGTNANIMPVLTSRMADCSSFMSTTITPPPTTTTVTVLASAVAKREVKIRQAVVLTSTVPAYASPFCPAATSYASACSCGGATAYTTVAATPTVTVYATATPAACATTCSSGCTDLTSDDNNCGACGNICGTGLICGQSVCVSPTIYDCTNTGGACGGTCGGTCFDDITGQGYCKVNLPCAGLISCVTGADCASTICLSNACGQVCAGTDYLCQNTASTKFMFMVRGLIDGKAAREAEIEGRATTVLTENGPMVVVV
ncbi:hypothetical protein G7Y89_g13209 [Cudoniella acicularis]|uniref:Polymer-forming cytoskeletal protein n=1 Tax=Cudoniella acicularis TaxID=354080 RepID=A0A8H4R7V0_9HELO|nr:hypothetical protein G7Y89_g13209 [Cudoniella acicularis]